MTHQDIPGLVLSYLYAFGLLFIVEAIGRRFGWRQHVTRKIVHIGAGMWIWGILVLFDSRAGLIPFATFIVLNYVFYRFRVFGSMDTVDSSPGTVYFAVSVTVLFLLLWRPDGPVDRVAIASAAVMAMTWGDGAASIVGRSIGKHPYRVLGHQRTWEGTAAMAIATFASMALTLYALPASPLSPHGSAITFGQLLPMALIGTGVATAAEGLSPAGTDNLTVPLLTGAVLTLFTL